jgi:hypothetical protein
VDCPLCLSSVPTGKQLERHVGRHLEELALFALPRSEEDGDDTTPVTRYKCQECDKLDTDMKGTLMRHVNDMHFPRLKFFCPEKGCHDVWRPRQNRITDHVMLAHRRYPTKGELLLHKRDMPCPRQCPGCSLPIRTWDEFTKCYSEHCTYKVSMTEVQNESYSLEEIEFAVTTRKKEREGSIDKNNE